MTHSKKRKRSAKDQKNDSSEGNHKRQRTSSSATHSPRAEPDSTSAEQRDAGSNMDINAFMQHMLFAANGTGGGMLNDSDIDDIKELLQSEQVQQKLEGANRLCTFYSMCQHPMAARVSVFAPILVDAFSSESNTELLILLARCITNMVDVTPEAGFVLFRHGLLNAINERLLNVEYIDLAEQCIRCLENLAQDFAGHLLQSDVLTSAMTYIDFHALPVQRKVLKISTLLTKRVEPDNFEHLQSNVGQLCNFMTSDDKHISECACESVANTIIGIQDDLEAIEDLASNHPIVEKFVSLFSSKDFLTGYSKNCVSLCFVSMRVLCQHSITAFEQSLKKDMGNILSEAVSMNRALQSEATQILVYLLPPIKDQITSNMPKHRCNSNSLIESHIAEYEKEIPLASTSSDANDPNVEFYVKHPDIFKSFSSIALPQLLEAFSSTTDSESNRLNCLSGIAAISSFGSAEVLKEVMLNVQISTFLADLLSSNNLVYVSTAIQMCSLLISKLPDIFKVYFVREGVVSELEKISGLNRQNYSQDSIIDHVRKQLRSGSTQKEKSKKDKTSPKKKSSKRKTTTTSSTTTTRTTTTSSPQSKHSRNSPSSGASPSSRGRILNLLSRKKKSHSSEGTPTRPRKSKKKESSSKFDVPIPEESRFSPQKCKLRHLKSPELREYSVLIADEIHRLHFNDSADESAFLKDLNDLSEKLLAVSKSGSENRLEQEKCLETLRDMINIGRDGEKITNFEFLGSRVIPVILQYLRSADLSQLAIFLNVFNKPLTVNAKDIMASSASSPFKKQLHHADSIELSHLREFNRRLQECLSSEESLDMYEGPSVGTVQALQQLNRPLKVLLESPKKTKNSIVVEIKVTAMAPVSALVSQLQKLIKSKKGKKSNNSNQGNENAEASEDENDYFHTEEDEEDEDMMSPDVVELNPSENVEQRDQYDFLYREVELGKSDKGLKYELFADDDEKPVDNNDSVFKALWLSSKKFRHGSHPHNVKMWHTRHKLKYRHQSRKRRSSTKTMTHLHSRVLEHIKDADDLDALRKNSQQKQSVVSIFQLLHIFDVLNTFNTEIVPFGNEVIPRDELVNQKLCSKVIKQLRDPFVVLSEVIPPWITFLTTKTPFLFSLSVREAVFSLTSLGIGRALTSLQKRAEDTANEDEPRIQISNQKIRIPREDIFRQAFNYFVLDKSSNRSRIEVEFFDEVGTGQGPSNEFFSLLSEQFKRSDLKMWLNTDESSEYVVSSSGLYPRYIDPQHVSAQTKTFQRNAFYFLGKYLARAIMDERLVDLPLSLCLLKQLKGEKLYIDDIRHVDPQIYQSIKKFKDVSQFKQQIERSSISEEEKKAQIENLQLDGAKIEHLCQTFVLIGTNIQLCPNGADKEVTIWNLEEFLSLTTQWILKKGVQIQIQALKEGFRSLVDPCQLRMLTNNELEVLLAGDNSPWTIETLRESIVCDHGYTSESMAIEHLMSILSDFNYEQRKAFVKFVTGSSRLPVGGLSSLNPKLKVVRKTTGDSPDEFLPSCMTCTHYLKLPDYSSEDVMYEQLTKAIQEGQNAFHLS